MSTVLSQPMSMPGQGGQPLSPPGGAGAQPQPPSPPDPSQSQVPANTAVPGVVPPPPSQSQPSQPPSPPSFPDPTTDDGSGYGDASGSTPVYTPDRANARPVVPVTAAAGLSTGDPTSRAAVWRDLLAKFTFSIAKGLEARAKNPRAGIGEALSGAYDYDQIQAENQLNAQKQALQAAQEARTKAASDALMQKMQNDNAALPAKIQEMLASANRNNASATTSGIRASILPQQAADAHSVAQATIAEKGATAQSAIAEAASKQFLKLGDSVYNLNDLIKGGADIKPVVGSVDGGISFTITPALAAGLGQPDLEGKVVSAKVGKELADTLSAVTKTTQTAEGVRSDNLITGGTTRLGTPAAVAAVNARPTDVITPGGVPQVVTAQTAIDQHMVPGNLASASKLAGEAATFANFHSNANRVKELLPVIAQPGASERIAAAMGQPSSTLGQYIQGQLATGNLTQPEYDLVNALGTFREDSFNLRQFFGNAPIRSDKMVQLMMNQIPSVADLTTGDPAKVATKIANFERSVHAVEAQYGPLTDILKDPKFRAANTPAKTTPPPPATKADVEIGPDGRVIINNNKQKKAGGPNQ